MEKGLNRTAREQDWNPNLTPIRPSLLHLTPHQEQGAAGSVGLTVAGHLADLLVLEGNNHSGLRQKNGTSLGGWKGLNGGGEASQEGLPSPCLVEMPRPAAQQLRGLWATLKTAQGERSDSAMGSERRPHRLELQAGKGRDQGQLWDLEQTDPLSFSKNLVQKKGRRKKMPCRLPARGLHCPRQGPAPTVTGESPVSLPCRRPGAPCGKFETVPQSPAEELGRQVPRRLRRRRPGVTCWPPRAATHLTCAEREEGRSVLLLPFYFLIHCVPACKPSRGFRFRCGP